MKTLSITSIRTPRPKKGPDIFSFSSTKRYLLYPLTFNFLKYTAAFLFVLLIYPMASFTKTIHKEPYPAISPSLPSLSQAGKTVLITGGSTGIGYAIARAFAFASASKIIILGRRADLVDSAASTLTEETPEFKGEIVGQPCDISDSSSVAALWSDLERDGVIVDVLVLNAARIGKPGSIIKVGLDEVWADYVMNVRANLDLVERFLKQNERVPNGKKKVCSLLQTSDLAPL
jgi:hypothetical protein